MALGDLKGGPFDLVYRAKGTGTLTAGFAVAFDSSGNAIPATASTTGKHGIYTGITHIVGATTYYGICLRGRIVCSAGGAIKPNKLVVSDGSAEIVAATLTVSATYNTTEQTVGFQIIGTYLRVDGDAQYAAADAADGDEIIVDVGGF